MLDLHDLQRELEQAVADGRQPMAFRLNPATAIHVADPALGLEPLAADEMDALDGVPVEIDPTVPVGVVAFRD